MCAAAVLDPEATEVSESWAAPSGSAASSWGNTFSGSYGSGHCWLWQRRFRVWSVRTEEWR